MWFLYRRKALAEVFRERIGSKMYISYSHVADMLNEANTKHLGGKA